MSSGSCASATGKSLSLCFGTLVAEVCGELLVLIRPLSVWQDIDAAYLFQDMGDIDDDLSSLLVPDLDFSSIAALPEPSVPKIPQTGAPNLDTPLS